MSWTVSDLPSLSGRTILVTGPGGLGYETALALARAGADVILAGRNPLKGEAALAQIRASVPQPHIAFEQVDLASLVSIKVFAERLLQSRRALDLLVNNAGVMAPPKRQTTADGFELQFGTNYLGHFALTAQLLPLLCKGSRPRIVSISSLAHPFGKIDFSDLQTERSYKPFRAYCLSKLAQLMFALELQRRSDAKGWGLMSNAAHPGRAATDLIVNGQGSGSFLGRVEHLLKPLFWQSAAAGAQPTLYAATAPAAAGGILYGPDGFMEGKGAPKQAWIAPAARQLEVAARLWEISEHLTGVKMG
jgi:NAD(P)-dependent dehydrogenase (short-subunit alcohol dehydrogenase family)